MGVMTRALGVEAVFVAAFMLAACNFNTGPLAGGPGLEPPGTPNREGAGGAGAFPTAGTGTSAPVGGAAGSVPPVPGDSMSPMDAAVPEPDAGMLMPDASEMAPPDAGGTSHDAAVSDAGGVGTCRGWVKPIEKCPEQCQTCDTARGICNIACTGFTGSCNDTTVECPPGWACDVACTGLGVCTNGGVNCADGPCEVTCSGLGSCSNWTIQCGRDVCSASCTGFGSNSDLSFESGESCNADGC